MSIIEKIIEQYGADSTTVQVLQQFFPIIEQAEAYLQSQDREDAERYRFLKQHCTDSHVKTSGKFMLPDLGVLCFEWRRRGWKDGSPYVIHELDEAIEHARRIEEDGE